MAENDVTFSRIPDAIAERWALVRAICACDEKAIEKYLPTLNKRDTSADNNQRNETYRRNAVLYNATGYTRDGLIGLAFGREPNHEGLPARLEYLLQDADGAGVSLFQQSQATLASVLEIGRHGLYVDWSEARQRPVIKPYLGEDIINWRANLIDGAVRLTMLVLHESAEVDDGFAVTYVDQWRELRLVEGKCICTVWQRPDPKAPPIVVRGSIVVRSPRAPFDSIPFQFAGSQNNDASIDDAPLYPLAYINRHHFRNSADYEDSVFFVGQAQPWMSGLTEEWRDWLQDKGIYVGSRAPVLLPSGGVYGFAQAQPNMLAMEAMKHKEDQMRALGARLVEETKAHTATQSDNDKEASTSVLSTCVGNVTAAYQSAIDLCARYLDIEPAANAFRINKDFVRLLADAQTIGSMVDAWQKGVIAKADVRSFMRERSFVPPDRTDKQIDADIALDPSAGVNPAAAATAGAVAGAVPASDAQQGSVDFAPLLASIGSLVEAIGKPEAPPQAMDMAGLIDAIRAQPTPVVNVAAPVVNVPAPQITVEAQPAPTINIAPPAVTVESPTVNLPAITMPPVNVTIEKAGGVKFTEDANGNITGAVMN